MSTRKGSMFTAAKASSAPLAIRPSALSLFWAWGCGTPNDSRGRTMVVTISGPLEQRASWWDGYDAILERFREACKDEETTSIALRLDSPGGECAGLNECVRLMLDAKEACGKRVAAYADESAYSAAYALACVADEIYLPPSGGVGSVGVIATCLSRQRMMSEIGIDVAVLSAGARKADCHPDLPLSDEALAGVQEDVDALAVMFRELVAESRGVSPEDVRALEAGCFMGDEAIAAGLADGVMGFDELVAMLDKDSAGDTTTTDTSGAAALNQGSIIMRKQTAAKAPTTIKASDVIAVDALSRPQVATVDASELAPIASALAAGKDGPSAGTAPARAGDPPADDDEDEEEAAETSTETTTTTTTTTEEEEGDDDEDEDEEEAAAAANRPAPVATTPRNVTSATVLKTIAELTGETSPAAQIGALTAMRDRAAKSATLEKANRKATKKAEKMTLRATIDGAVKAGTLEPHRRAWALTQSKESLDAYLKGSEPVVPRTPLAQANTKGPSRTAQPAAGEGVISEAIAHVAHTMQMDPKAVADHAAALAKAGVIH